VFGIVFLFYLNYSILKWACCKRLEKGKCSLEHKVKGEISTYEAILVEQAARGRLERLD
jgi:hypothetical protein